MDIEEQKALAAKYRAQQGWAGSTAANVIGIAMVLSGLLVLILAISSYEQPYSYTTCAQLIEPGDLDMKTSPRPRPRPDDLTP